MRVSRETRRRTGVVLRTLRERALHRDAAESLFSLHALQRNFTQQNVLIPHITTAEAVKDSKAVEAARILLRMRADITGPPTTNIAKAAGILLRMRADVNYPPQHHPPSPIPSSFTESNDATGPYASNDEASPNTSDNEAGLYAIDDEASPYASDDDTGLYDSDVYGADIILLAAQCDGKVDALVLGVDTGNAATHLSRALREAVPGIQIVGVEPTNSAIGETSVANPLARRWLYEDIGRAYAPRALAPGLIDMWIQVSDAVAYSITRRFIKQRQQRGNNVGNPVRSYDEVLFPVEWMLVHDLLDTRMLSDLQCKQHGQYRGTSAEDLQLPAAVSVSGDDSVGAAVVLMARTKVPKAHVTTTGSLLLK
ncbi:hypothetical protein LPJ53_004990 [Coemansia erecta]|uniref:Uncharacterized protein n=1 Tax=Coemansia erecta TaxID=147472 RepID=A0A9W7XWP2_9FUNG|nr:hypothetical protein LPJ53_004990 [Coemansia erecta]